MKIQDRFDEQRKDEKTKSTARRTHDDMIKQLVNSKPLLRPLPPKSMKPLKPYAEKLFELQNKELADYLSKCGHEFVNKCKVLADRKIIVCNRTQAARKLLCADNGEYYTTRQNKKLNRSLITSMV